MNQFQSLVPASAFKKLLGEGEGSQRNSGSADSEQEASEPATVAAAGAVSEGFLHHKLSEQEKAWAGLAVHYSLDSSAGALYGILVEAEPRITIGAGLPFGTAFWLLADEGAVPALGLSGPPWRHPPSTHAYALASLLKPLSP